MDGEETGQMADTLRLLVNRAKARGEYAASAGLEIVLDQYQFNALAADPRGEGLFQQQASTFMDIPVLIRPGGESRMEIRERARPLPL